MEHYGILSLPIRSHLRVLTTIAHEMVRRGHRVTLINLPQLFDPNCSYGIEFVSLADAERAAELMRLFERSAHGSALGRLRAQIEFDRLYYKTVVTYAPALIRENGVEKLICDQALICSSTVAEMTGLSFASVACGLPLNRETHVPPFFSDWPYRRTPIGALRNWLGYGISGAVSLPIARDLNRLRTNAGLKRLTILDESFSPFAQISQQISQVDFPRERLPPTFHNVGPIRPPQQAHVPFPFEKLTGERLIYCTFGTTVNQQLPIFRMIAEACTEIGAQLVMTLGGPANERPKPRTESQIVVDYAPQLELLQRAALTITHAGMITCLDSLSCGVPILAIPIAFEQPASAARIAYIGAGEVLPKNKLSVGALRSAINRVLSVPEYTAKAKSLQGFFERTRGREKAADILEALP